MNPSGQTYIPVSYNSSLAVGDSVNLKTAKIITLCRKDQDDIVRILE